MSTFLACEKAASFIKGMSHFLNYEKAVFVHRAHNVNTVAILMSNNGLFQMAIFFFVKFLKDMSHFCGATDTPVLDFW